SEPAAAKNRGESVQRDGRNDAQAPRAASSGRNDSCRGPRCRSNAGARTISLSFKLFNTATLRSDQMKLQKSVRQIGAVLMVLAVVLLNAGAARAQAEKTKTNPAAAQSSEKKGELQLAAAKTNPLQLRQFIKKMPKGADLHYHLSGGVYAETFI